MGEAKRITDLGLPPRAKPVELKFPVLDKEKIKSTVGVAMRMLDNVIDNNYYPTPEAEVANMRHRAVGLGLMGGQHLLLIQLHLALY